MSNEWSPGSDRRITFLVFMFYVFRPPYLRLKGLCQLPQTRRSELVVTGCTSSYL